MRGRRPSNVAAPSGREGKSAARKRWRRGWDSNPWSRVNGTRDFQSRLFVHSSTSPQRRPGTPVGDASLRTLETAWQPRMWSNTPAGIQGRSTERVGFEPTMRLLPYQFSRLAPSAARPPLPVGDYSIAVFAPNQAATRRLPLNRWHAHRLTEAEPANILHTLGTCRPPKTITESDDH